MKLLRCRCGQRVYFDNASCNRCSRQLGFDPILLDMRSEEEPGSGLNFCGNRYGPVACNWLEAEGATEGQCVACRSSAVIPSLSKYENLERWRRLEAAKRRLVYDLLMLGLPVDTDKLRFVFKEDQRSNPDVHEEHVNIGHAEGVITINAAEADDVYRESMRAFTGEPYRTLLGHFRHESGHFYWDVLIDESNRAAARSLFGDETQAYDVALQQYYAGGPAENWQQHFISAYASAHPAEDWAECFAHFLHLRAVLETAEANGLMETVEARDGAGRFIEVIVKVNEVMRNLGLNDAYPFILNEPVIEKIMFIRDRVSDYTGREDEWLVDGPSGPRA